MAFIESPRFPDDIAYGSKAGVIYRTSVSVQANGYEKRNIYWSQGRHKYDVAYTVRNADQLSLLINFFHSTYGRAHGFRFKDFSDFHTNSVPYYGDGGSPSAPPTKDDQEFALGDGAETEFQLIKKYISGTFETERAIYKPVAGTVLIAVDGVLQTESTNYTIDYTTGIVTFISPPAGAASLTWGGEFDVPVRFESDEIETNLEFYLHGSANVGLIEDLI